MLISGGKSKNSLPSAWAPPPRNPRSLQALAYLKVEDMRIKYIGPGESDMQAATILTNYPTPIDWPLYFFEVLIVNKGTEGFIGIGFCNEDVSLSRLPGWDPHSYGYHGDDGHVFLGSGRGMPFGPTFTTGDRIGCLLNRSDRSISYFKNGESLGEAIRGIPEERLFPCIGMRTKDEEVQVLLPSPATLSLFKSADLEAITSSYRASVTNEIDDVEVPFSQAPESQHEAQGDPRSFLPLLPQLVLDYLLHHRCSETASILRRDLLGPSQADQQGLEDGGRQQVFDLISSGRIEEAVKEIEARWSSAILERDSHLHFRVKVAIFCEIIRGGKNLISSAEAEKKKGQETEGPSDMDTTSDNGDDTDMIEKALAFGRQVLAAHTPRSSADDELLSDALSLLAYEDPAASPCGSLLGQAERTSLAEAVNGAILAHLGLPAVSPLERVLHQGTACIEILKQQNHPQALVLDIKTQFVK